jgi:Tfp pilus assembly protein PilW
MITCTPRIDSGRQASTAAAAFTLVEVMIAAALSTLVLAGVLSAFLTISRTSLNSSSYSEMEAETRRSLEIFSQDVRSATDIHWNSNQSITLTLPGPTSSNVVMSYAFDNVAQSATAGCFYRVAGNDPTASPRQVLARGVSELSFQRFKLERPGAASNQATNDLETKQLQLTIRAGRQGHNTVAANQSALSACYIMRNKRVSN